MSFKVPKITALVATTLTLCVLLFGFSQFGMDMDMNNGTANCLFSNHSMSVCNINPVEHIQELQSAFTTLPIKDAAVSFSILLVILVLLGLGFFGKYSLLYNKSQFRFHFSYFYLNNIFIPNPLVEAFSRGILNSKTF